MSKRWKVRQKNAAKLEKSREVMGQFYDNVIAGLEQMSERVKSGDVLLESPLGTQQLACGNRVPVENPTTITVQ